jgi:hypothetical protein
MVLVFWVEAHCNLLIVFQTFRRKVLLTLPLLFVATQKMKRARYSEKFVHSRLNALHSYSEELL